MIVSGVHEITQESLGRLVQVVTREDWVAARKALLVKEKEATRL